MLNHRKSWYFRQDVEVRSNGLFLWTKKGEHACLINNLPYAYGFGAYSVNVVHMKGRKDLMYVLGFVDPHTEYDGVTQFYLVAVKYKKGSKKNCKSDKFEWQEIKNLMTLYLKTMLKKKILLKISVNGTGSILVNHYT